MLVIKAKHKTSGTEYQFSPAQWYTEQQTGNYNYLGTIHVSEPAQPIHVSETAQPMQRTVTPKRGCGCANKRR
jgi:hypothetical protein